MAKRTRRNVEPVAKGDKFTVTNEVTFLDVDGDNVTDCVLKHCVDKNGANFVDSVTTWYGLDDVTLEAFQDALAKAGLKNGTREVKGFQKLMKEWKKLTQALTHINNAGDEAVKNLGLD